MKKSLAVFSFLLSIITFAQSHDQILSDLEKQEAKFSTIALTIWDHAEMGYQEEQSSALLQKTLQEEGFAINKGVAGIPTAFVAEYANGEGPIIAILGEYDALPGLSQKAVSYKVSNGKRAGHACGHHLFGTASAAAAISIKKYIEQNKIKGTVRFYGCPAEEGGSGKVT